MKIKGFLEDISGIRRITKARLDAIKNAPADPIPEDPIRKTAEELHPGPLDLVVTSVVPAGKDVKTFRFAKPDGAPLPPFRSGQYLVLTLEIDGKLISRPYSISSGPQEARKENGFVEITVKKPRKDGFFADRILESLKEGDPANVLIGVGEFCYEPLRDADHILALAGGIGITPFLSMAKEIAAGKTKPSITILYGADQKEDLILFDTLQELEKAAPDRIRVVPVLRNAGEETDGDSFEHGLLSAELIGRYLKGKGDTSLFICGPQPMYRYLKSELLKLSLPARRIRFEVFGSVKNISAYEGYPKEAAGRTFSMTVQRGIREDVIPASASESIASALERAGIRLETACRSGECGFCRTKVLSGSYFVCPENDGRRAADKDFNYVHACSAFPLSDLKIRIPIA